MKKSRTCIALIRTRTGKLIMAGDSRGSYGWDLATECARPKVYKKKSFLLGATGSGSMCSLLTQHIKVPNYIPEPLDNYMVNTFKNDITGLLIKHGYFETTSHGDVLALPEPLGSLLLVGVNGQGFEVEIESYPDTDKSWGRGIIHVEPVKLPWAVGCGGNTAYPILFDEFKEKGYNTREVLKKAMERAAEISPGCDNNIDYIEV